MTEDEYNEVFNLFEGDEILIGFVSSFDSDGLARYLMQILDGSPKGIERLEKLTNKIIEFSSKKEKDDKIRLALEKALITAYSNIIVRFKSNKI